MDRCYFCGAPATVPVQLKATFTSQNLARVPDSRHSCERCDYWLNLRCWYFNPHKQQWSKLFSRNWSSLFVDGKLISPIIEGNHSDGKDTFPTVRNLPTRAEIRSWLLEPPQPPFTICIAESGQKHIVMWSQIAYSRERFPVQFEMDNIQIDRQSFAESLSGYEKLLTVFSKTEIDTGEYHSDRLLKFWALHNYDYWQQLESDIARLRGGRLLQLLSYVAIAPPKA